MADAGAVAGGGLGAPDVAPLPVCVRKPDHLL